LTSSRLAFYGRHMKSGLVLIGLVLTAAPPTACMDPLHDYGDCVKIEKARCELRETCDASFDLDTCIAYYEEYCRTRKIDPPDGVENPNKNQIDACISAIAEVPCTALSSSNSETDDLPECSFLWSADEDASVEDTGTDTTDAG
jgi:hypothetical protein